MRLLNSIYEAYLLLNIHYSSRIILSLLGPQCEYARSKFRHLASIEDVEKELNEYGDRRELWASCMEKRRDGKRALLPDLDCFRIERVKKEPTEPSRTPLPERSFGRFDQGMFSIESHLYHEGLGYPLGTFQRPCKSRRGGLAECVVYLGRYDRNLRDQWPYSLPVSNLKPYSKNIGSVVGENLNRFRTNDGGRRSDDNDYYSRVKEETELARAPCTDDAETVREHPQPTKRARAFESLDEYSERCSSKSNSQSQDNSFSRSTTA